MAEDRQFLRAKDYAYRLLSYRQRSTKEINQRLKKKGFTPRVIKRVIQHLSRLDYLNDERFARFWIQAKIQASPVGWSLLRYQLRQKGIASAVLEKALAACASDYNEIDAAKGLARSRGARYKTLEPLKLKRRLYAYLRRRGFSQEAILEAIK